MAKIRMTDPDEEIKEVKIEKKIDDGFFPIDVIPSKYKLYKEGAKIFGRPLKVSEVKKLSTMNENNFNFILKDVLSATLRGIEIDELCTADKIYLIFWLRANTYKNANFTAKYSCEKCDKKNEYKFDVDSFDVEYLSDDYTETEFELLNSPKKITLDFPRVRDEERIKRFQDSLKNGLAKFDDETIVMASMISSIDGIKINLRQACEFILSLEDLPEDYAYLHSKILEMDFGLIPEIKHICSCGGVNVIPVSFRSDFFLPQYNFR